MPEQLQSIRGMNDVLPDAVAAWHFIESTCARVLAAYGYGQIRLPLVERTELFARSIGAVTDIVEKEMYTFDDRDKHSLSLRPEGTAGVVRAGIQHGALVNQVQRWWYTGPMFRHERPQRGRLRQFHQVGVEAFGLATPDIDAELILIGARLWRELGLKSVALQINSLGTSEERGRYRARLVEYLQAHTDELDDDSRRRLHSNPLRVLDSKNPALAALLAAAPKLADELGEESADHFAELQRRLDEAGVDYTVNPRLVRGLDYYSQTVFEWVTDKLGAQGAVCAGGRYDRLVEQLGGKPAPAVGFALGIERLVELLGEDGVEVPVSPRPLYVAAVGLEARRQAQQVAERLRDAGRAVVLSADDRSFKSQLKKADKLGAAATVIIGQSEAEAGTATVKPMTDKIGGGDQVTVSQAELIEKIDALRLG